MFTTDKFQVQRGLRTILVALLIVWAGGATVRADSDSTIHVNAGEAITLTVDSVSKLFIADPAVADTVPLSDKEINIIGKKLGVTTLTILRADNKPTQVYRIEVGNDSIGLLLRKVVNAPSITVRSVGDMVIVDGYVNDELDAQRVTAVLAAIKGTQVLNLLEVRKPRQVRIRTRIAEVDSTAIKQIGFQWFGPQGQVEYAMQFVGGGSIVHGLIPTGSQFTEGTSFSPATVTLTTLLELLITKNYARLLSEPTLTTLSGKEASFLVGQEIPIVQQLPQSFTVEFKEVGVRMKIKPTVDSQNQINTAIHAEVTQITGNSVLGIPILGAKTADTTLQAKDGQTIVIGGLLDNNISRDFFRKLPWLGDIPGLGLLFRNKETQKDQNEVLFFMTPEIVKDVDAEAAAAAQTPVMKNWLGNWNAKVLKVPKKGYDWSLADPQGAGFEGDSKKAEKAEKAKAKTKVPAPSSPGPTAPAAPAAESPAKPEPAADPSTNFAPARPAGN